MKYEEWLTIWLDNYIKPNAKAKTFENYFNLIRNHITKELGHYGLEDITTIMIQMYITKLLKEGNVKTNKGLAPSTVNTIITIIQLSLKTAASINLIQEYKLEEIKRPKVQFRELSCFSLEEQRKIETAILKSPKAKMIGIIICLYTGVRIGELLALTWEDIDFHNNLIMIKKTCHYGIDLNGHYTRMINEPKTITSKRMIPFSKHLLPLLKRMKSKQSIYLISDGQNPISVRSYQRSFSLLLKKIKIPHKGFHALRHTFATRALECGMDVKTLSEILGHKNASITLNRYVHSLMEHKKQMMEKMTTKLFPKTK